MVDTIGIFCHWDFNPAFVGVDFYDKLGYSFEESKEEMTKFGNLKRIVELDNLRIKATQKSLSIENSLCKAYRGNENNVDTLTFPEIKLAIEKIENAIGGISLTKGSITRLDWGANLSLDKPASQYLSLLVDSPGYDKLPYPTTGLYFAKQCRRLCFYDKMQSGDIIPPAFFNDNLLRYELKYMGKLGQQFKRKILVEDLFDKGFFNNVLDNWYNEYHKIHKQKSVSIEYTKATDVADFMRLRHLKSLLDEGRDLGTMQAEDIQEAEILDILGYFKHRNYKAPFIDSIKNYYSKGFSISDLQKELDGKMQDAYNRFKQ